MKTRWIIILLILFIIAIVSVPIIINESYKTNAGYITSWGAEDLLMYSGSVISAIGTIFIGIIAFKQNNRANDINDKLLKLQEVNATPYLLLDVSACKIQCFNDKEIDMIISFRNETNSAINITKISDMKITHMCQSEFKIPFCEGWNTYYSVFPHQTKEINFFIENSKESPKTFDVLETTFSNAFTQLVSEIEIDLHFVNSTDVYRQKLEFFLHIISPKDNKKKYGITIFNIENSIVKKEL